MSKKVVICCDGTWNRPDQSKNGTSCPTNVTKVAVAIGSKDDHGVEQLVYYHKGLGTGKFDRLRGGAFGRGLSENIKDAYLFLIANYEVDDDFSFSGLVVVRIRYEVP